MEGGDSPPNANGSARPFQSKKEKSTAILLAIILIFVACHLLRFIVQIYEVFSGPLHGSHKLYQVSNTYFCNLTCYFCSVVICFLKIIPYNISSICFHLMFLETFTFIDKLLMRRTSLHDPLGILQLTKSHSLLVR